MFIPKDQIKRFDEFEFGASCPIGVNGMITKAVVTRLGVCSIDELQEIKQSSSDAFKAFWSKANG